MMAILFQRELLRIGARYLRYIMIDSSPQLGCNYLCVREDRIKLPGFALMSPQARASYDRNEGFETRIMPLSTLGLGHAGLVKKGINTANLYLMESEEEEDFHTIRNEVFGSTMDSGTEKDVGNDTVGIIARFAGLFNPEDPQSFMYPKLLHMPGHLHLLFNALETSVKKLEMAAKFFDALRAIESFLSNRQLRRKFQVSCLSTAPLGVSQ